MIRHYTITLKVLTNIVKPSAHQPKAGVCLVVLKIDSVQTHMHVCVCVCVSTPDDTSGVMWCNMNTIRLVKQILQLCMAAVVKKG